MFDPLQPELSEQSNLDFRPPQVLGQSCQPSTEMASVILQDRWEILEPLGQGGMGTVYKARDQRLANRLCVVKKLRVDNFKQEEREQALEFFDREARMLSNLKHPNIVRIYDRFRENENYYLVMEYVEGENLEHMLTDQGEPFSEEQVTEWAIKICQVLHYLHSCTPPVIYRDLKPSNIMLDTVDGIKLVDFGIARPYRDDMDNTHVVSGGYSPPEQYWGGADTRSDIYALGATMHFLLTGVEPVALSTSSPKQINPKLSDKIDRVVQKATSQYVEMRYQYACGMRENLEASSDQAPRPLSAKLIATLCIIALIPLIAFGSSFLANVGKNIADSFTAGSTTRARGEADSVGSLSQSPGSKVHALLDYHPAHTKSVNGQTQAKIAPIGSVASILQPQQNGHTGSYSLDQAAAETREEMMTDPEGLKTDADGAEPSNSNWP